MSNNQNRICVIGDIHGEIGQLNELLEIVEGANPALHLFLGDLVDNKTATSTAVNQLAVLEKVYSLVSSGKAQCIMGNHEFNAIGWYTLNPTTQTPLRPHTEDNHKQHKAFLTEVGEGSDVHQKWINWFKTLPLFIETEDYCAIHACWQQKAINQLKPYLNADNSLKEVHWLDAFNKEHELHSLIELLMKGPEISLPAGHSFLDKNGKERNEIRIKWWDESLTTYQSIATSIDCKTRAALPDIELPQEQQVAALTKPVFVGHYKMEEHQCHDDKQLLDDKVACLDFYNNDRVDLTAYLYSSEQTLNQENFVSLDEESEDNVAQINTELQLALDQIYGRVESYNHPLELSKANLALIDKVNAVLINDWDPLKVSGRESCEDEYDRYVELFALEVIYGDKEHLAHIFKTFELYLIDEQISSEKKINELCDRLFEISLSSK